MLNAATPLKVDSKLHSQAAVNFDVSPNDVLRRLLLVTCSDYPTELRSRHFEFLLRCSWKIQDLKACINASQKQIIHYICIYIPESSVS